MKVPTFKLKEVEAPWTRWRRQFNDWAARKEAEAAARKAKEAQERAELEAARARAADAPVPVGAPSNSEEVAALRDRLAFLENAWNAFHQSRADMELLPAEHEVMLQRISALEDRLQPGNLASDTDHEAFRQQVVDLWNAIHRIENELRLNRPQQVADLRAVVDGLQAEVAAFRAAGLKAGTGQDNLAPIRKDLLELRGQIAAAVKAGAGKGPGAIPVELKAQLDALKLKVAAVEAEDQATRAGLVALQEKQDLDEQNLASLRKELETEVVADPK